jgi:hypothetical protein
MHGITPNAAYRRWYRAASFVGCNDAPRTVNRRDEEHPSSELPEEGNQLMDALVAGPFHIQGAKAGK